MREHRLFGVAMLPLLAGWAVALLLFRHDAAWPAVLAVGTVATISALLLGVPVWAWGFREGTADLSPGGPHRWMRPALRWLGHAAGALAFTGAWVWLQYALNPYRMRPLGEAILTSRSLAWQAMAGLWLYGSVAMLARAAGARQRVRVRVPEASPTTPLDRLAIRLGERTIIVAVNRIERLQAADDYVAVHAEGRRLLASHRISELAARLDPASFVRVHRSHIVNLSFVAGFERLPGDRIRVRLRSGATVPASRAGSALLRARLP
jgi:DNA-binding LytR/AlgR family response regulator